MAAKPISYAVWPTAWGPVGGVAAEEGLCQFILPHYSLADLKALLAFENKGAAENPSAFAELAELTRQYFNGQSVDFSAIACQMPGQATLAGMVLRYCRTIPYGQTVSYSRLAQLIERPDAARAVASALGRNAIPLVIPCHRVVYAGGKLGGFSAPGGEDLKRRMLTLEKAKAS
jgi:methylated-DNA-[protein]-cysteine S-methyltransferase